MKKPNKSSGFVAYYRVSDPKQGISGLGLEAQKASVEHYIANVKSKLLAEYTEIESGKTHKNRPQLAAALGHAKRLNATLLIAKLDRLARNVHFISGLMESGVPFTAIDMPQANKLTIHIMAAMAEHEREMISQRTKEALAAVRARGVKLGNPRWQESIAKARAARTYPRPFGQIVALITEDRRRGEPLRVIADHLNELGMKTPSGARWYPSSVRAALLRAQGKAPVIELPKVAA